MIEKAFSKETDRRKLVRKIKRQINLLPGKPMHVLYAR